MKIVRTPSNDIIRKMGRVLLEPTGFDRFNSNSMGDLSFVDGTLTFTIAPKAGQNNFYFYIRGKKFIKTTSQTVVITDTEGLWYIYFNSAGVLTASQTPWTFSQEVAFVAFVYWDAANNSAAGLGDERHGIVMDWATHEYLHDNFGALWQSGFTPDVIADGNGSLNSHCEIQLVTAGVVVDEDIEHSSSQQTTYSIWYQLGASGTWRKTTASAAAVAITTTRPDWNQFTAGAWQRTQVSNNNFTLVHGFATNSTSAGKVILVMGQNEYATLGAARTGADVELASLSTMGLPTMEFAPLFTLIIQCADAYTNSYNARIRTTAEGGEFIDWRQNERTGIGATASDHGNLTGLTDDDHPQYSLDSFELELTRMNTGNSYMEYTEVGGNITQVDYWTDSGKGTKLFTKAITYSGSNPTVVTVTNNVTLAVLTTTIAYSGDTIVSVTKVIS